jgi:hypothetical protein
VVVEREKGELVFCEKRPGRKKSTTTNAVPPRASISYCASLHTSKMPSDFTFTLAFVLRGRGICIRLASIQLRGVRTE